MFHVPYAYAAVLNNFLLASFWKKNEKERKKKKKNWIKKRAF